MPVVLSHASSLAVLRAVPPQTGALVPVERPVSLDELHPSSRELAHLSFVDLGVPAPLHVLTSVRRNQPKASGIATHALSLRELPEGSLLQGPDGLYVCSPELTFVQMSALTSLIGRVVLGDELCGSYSHFARLISGFYDRSPLTTQAELGNAITTFRGVRGVGKAREALPWIRGASRSPMETVVSSALFLPAREGGYGFKEPVLNQKVKLNEVASRMTHTRYCLIDVSWPDVQVGLEYESEAFHHDLQKDQVRREALMHMGWSIFTINLDEITNYRALAQKVSLFSGMVPRQPGKEASERAKRELLQRLLTATRYGLGLDSVLFSAPVGKGAVRVHL